MSQNGVLSRHSAGVARPPSVHSSSSVSWGGHSSVTVATSQTSTQQQQQQPGTPPGADYDAKQGAPASPQSSNQRGSTLKEHDLLGLSDSSSSRHENSAPTFHDEGSHTEGLNLNLEATELRLGPQDSSTRRKADSAFPFQRNGQEQVSTPPPPETASALEGVNFLDSIGDSSTVSEKLASVSESQTAVAAAAVPGPEAAGFSYSSLTPETGGVGGGGGEGQAGCRPLIANDSLRLGISLSQPKRPANVEDVSEKKSFLNSIDRSFHPEKLQEVKQQQQLLSEDSPFQARAWQQQQGRIGNVTDVIPEEPCSAEGVNKPSEKRPLPPALVPPEHTNRFQDGLADRSPRHNPQWHSQVMMRSSVEVSRQMQQDESPRNGYPGPHSGFPGGRVVFPPAKPGVSGSKRPFVDTIATGNSSASMNASPNDADNKPMYQPWAPKQGPTWQMLHSGGSFGPFPSQTPGRSMAMPTAEVAGAADSAQQKTYTKSLQESTEAEPAPAPAPEAAASVPRASAPPAHAVGWPPLRSFRKSAIAAQPRPDPVEAQPRPHPPPAQTTTPQPSVARQSNSWRVKVFLDGVPIGRKVDLEVYSSYEKLSGILDDMFRDYVRGQQSGKARNMALPDPEPFLHGSDYVLTYEDQDRDLMLVGDVPWTMFINTVKRLRIMKGSEAIGLGSRAAEKAANKSKGKV